MSNFKERQASAKKVIQLQNEILALKQQISRSTSPNKNEPCQECANLKSEIQDLLTLSEDSSLELTSEISTLKADLKKVRSENTRLKNKLKDSEIEED